MKYSPEIVQDICHLIETEDLIVTEICKRVGIAEATYYAWQNDHSEFSEAIKKSEKVRLQFFKQAARTGLNTLLHGKEYEEVTTEYVEGKPDAEGNTKPKIKLQRKVKKFIPPNPTSVIFALKSLDNDNFFDIVRQELTGKNGGAIKIQPDHGDIDYSKLSDETLREIARARITSNGSLNGSNGTH